MTSRPGARTALLKCCVLGVLTMVLVSCGTSDTPAAVLASGSKALSAGNCTEAVSDFSNYLVKNPNNVTAMSGLAECYGAQGLWNKAIDILTSVVKSAPTVQTYETLAQDYWDQGEAPSAYSSLLSAARLPGVTWQEITSLANQAETWQGYATSLQILNQEPNNEWTPNEDIIAGIDVSLVGAISQAASYFQEAVAGTPNIQLGDVWQQIGNAWYGVLNYSQALTAYEQSVKAGNSSDKHGLYVQLANTEANLGSLNLAQTDYQKALSYASSASQRQTDELQLGELMVRQGNIAGGTKILKTLLKPDVTTSVRTQAQAALASAGQ